MPLADLLEYSKEIESQGLELRNEILKLIWYMRGSVGLDEGFAMGYQDRKMISEIVKENMKTTKESGLPFF
jgi:hypothetical protein